MEEFKTKLAQELTPLFKELINIDPPTKEIIDKAYYMIKLGVHPGTRVKDHAYYPTILSPIIKLGDVDLFKKFVKEFYFDLEDIGDDYSHLFNLALQYSATDIVAWLIEKNHVSADDIQEGFIKLCTRVNLMSDYKAIDMAKILIKYGADIYNKSLIKQVYYTVGPRHPFYLFLTEEFLKAQKVIPTDANKTIQELTDKNVALNTEIESLKAENVRLKQLEKEFKLRMSG